MRTRLYNAQIMTMADELIISGEIWIKHNKIEYIGKRIASEEVFDKSINLNGNLIMPTFKNAHTHSAMTFARSYADDMPLNEWLMNKIFPLESKLTETHVYYYAMLANMEYLTSGISAVFDMYYEPEAMKRASIESGIRTVFCGAINNFKESVDILEGYYKQYNKDNELLSYMIGFHAEYTSSIDLMKEIGKLASKYKAPVYVHNSETMEEVKKCIEKYGRTPTKLFLDCGLYEYGGGGFHCTHLNEQDREIFIKKNLYAVLNTCSNLKLASGIAPAYKYWKQGMNLALGTDGPASNNALDMFREMYITAVLQKVMEEDAKGIPAYEVIKMATVNSAKAMGLSNTDVLAVGKYADLMVLDMNTPNMQPRNHMMNHILYSGGKHNIYMTMINGVIQYVNGKFSNIDSEKIYYHANKLLQTLK